MFLTTALFLTQCGAERPDASNGSGSVTTVATGMCSTEGAVRECHAVVAQRQGFVDCFNGTQRCVGGAWSPCDGANGGGGTLSTHAYSGGQLEATSMTVANGLHVLSLGASSPDAASCAADPCNPFCVGFDEQPDAAIAPQGCQLTITSPDAGVHTCGNGVVEVTEQCDDGNDDSGDGCSSLCQLEPGYYCPTPGAACLTSTCGNGIVEGLEQCDDGPWAADSTGTVKDRPYDGCYQCKREVNCPVVAGSPTPCTAVCGDGHVQPGEACDDGNTTNGDGCSSTCTVEPGATCTTITAPLPSFVDVPVIYHDRDTYGCAAGTYAAPDFQNGGCTLPNNAGATPTNDAVPHGVSGIAAGSYTYNLRQGIPAVQLSPADRLPVFNSTQGCVKDAASFNSWFHDGPLSKLILGKFIRLGNIGGTPTTFQFDSSADPAYGLANINCGTTTCASNGGFFPINGLGFGNQALSKNFSFTSEARFPFTYTGGEVLSFTGDDDVFVYIGGQKVVDIGGVHGALNASVTLSSPSVTTPASATTPPITLTPGQTYEIAVFQTERNTTGSNYKLSLGGFTKKISQCTPPATITISPPPAPLTNTNTYQVTGCPPGTLGQWNTFGYKVSTPRGTEVQFSVQTSPDGGAGTWVPASGSPAGIPVADVPLDHPGGNLSGAPSCQVTGPSPCGNNCAASIGAPLTSACPASCNCPIDLLAPLSAAPFSKANAQQPFLQVNAKLIPAATSCAGILSPGLLSVPNGINTCAGPKQVVVPNGPCTAATQYTDCDQDYHCDLVAGSPTFQKCIWNNGPNVWIDPTCNVGGKLGFDLSIEAGCEDAAGTHVPICNRGGATIPAGQVIEIWLDNSGGGCTKACSGTASKSLTCSYALPSPLTAGQCINIPPSAGCSFGTGERCMQVNPGNTVVDVNGNKECNSIANGPTWPTLGTGAGCNNNNAAVKATPSSCVACDAPLASGIPSLSSWQVTFACVPNE